MKDAFLCVGFVGFIMAAAFACNKHTTFLARDGLVVIDIWLWRMSVGVDVVLML
jgi:hypothetical protein